MLTVVELEATDEGTMVRMEVEPLHDDTWTGRMLAGRRRELENLAAVLAAR